jgi:hypothetical protein
MATLLGLSPAVLSKVLTADFWICFRHQFSFFVAFAFAS